MGWTHDYGDVAHDRSAPKGLSPAERAGNEVPVYSDVVTEPGIPHLLRRRARWFGARLRHARS